MYPRLIIIAIVVALLLPVLLFACGDTQTSAPETLAPPPTSVPLVELAPIVPEETTEPAPVITEVSEDSESATVSISNRGYNVKGSADAPITLFDFSDFQ